MWFLLLTSGITSLFLGIYTFKKFFSIDKTILFSQDNKKEENKNDEYNLICYRIVFEDKNKEEEVFSEITEEELDNIDEFNKIRFVIIEYMYNGRLCKMLIYDKKVSFPIYVFNVSKSYFEYYPEYIWLENVNITDYVRPYLGPLGNFYMDTFQEHYLKDILYNHPMVDRFDFDNDKVYMVSNELPFVGRKLIIKEANKRLIFKRHAALHIFQLNKLGLKLSVNNEIVPIDCED